jgi:hypothetical protein
MPFNVSNLYFVTEPGNSRVHITRTNLVDCWTECGVPMRRGWAIQTWEPPDLCAKCVAEIEALPYPRGDR